MAIDEFDTPPRLAAELVRIADVLCEYEPRIVADFSVGTGELLLAAKQRWPQAIAFGCDISEDRVEGLARCKSDWTVVRCDFLDCSSRSAVPDLENIRAKVDLAVLNPPFSARGGTKVSALIDGQAVRCSPAMAFVLFASQYLSHDGYLVALLPTGALESDRDQDARKTLLELGEFGAVKGTTERFPGGNPKVTIAYFKRNPRTRSPRSIFENIVDQAPPRTRRSGRANITVFHRSEPSLGPCAVSRSAATSPIKLLRGTSPNRAVQSDEHLSIPLVHSTELQGYTLRASEKTVPRETRSLCGPAVLIHRVGKPRRDKVVFMPKGPAFAVTDCVVALLSEDEEQCRRLQRSLTERYDLLERNYVGSGAPYITLARIQSVLETLGFASKVIDWRKVAHISETTSDG